MWQLFETPLIALGLAIVLAALAFAMLREYRRMFMQDPKSIMSAEVLVSAVTGAGGPGYFAAFLLTGAALAVGCAVLMLVLNVSSYLNRSLAS